MTTIWKFPLRLEDKQTVRIPQDAVVLSVQDQFGGMVLWAMVNDTNKQVDRAIYIFDTGEELAPDLDATYVGTVQQGRYVAHIFIGDEP